MVIPVILSGGSGTRLWPVSRQGHPKPFMKLPDGQSLLEKTYLRALDINISNIMTVTSRDYFFLSKDLFISKSSKESKGLFLLEPMGRNTAPAIAMAASIISEKFGENTIMLVLAADHLIENQPKFKENVQMAVQAARQGHLVTFGIQPTHPETGFGYIECKDHCNDGELSDVLRFIEKPNLEKATEYVASGKHLWNSGMFCFAAGTILGELKQHQPEMFNLLQSFQQNITHHHSNQIEAIEMAEEFFGRFKDISIDYAVLEKSNKIKVISSSFQWNDIGSWDSYQRLVPQDDNKNRIQGDVIALDTSNCYIHGEDRLIAALGLENLIVIDTADAILISQSSHAQKIKDVVQQLKIQDHEAYKIHKTVFRPWGSYTVMEEKANFKIKRIEVRPGAALSLQMHHHRSEHWIVVSGMAKVTNDKHEYFVDTNESTFIKAGHAHRLENPGLLNLVMIEVQSGSYLGEDDIVRFQDNYGRVAPQ